MEVHHHPHVEKKNFKEYFFEFFMLFLAVTTGFFAENLREHFKEHRDGVQYIKSFISDLEEDTSVYSHIIGIYQEKKAAFNELNSCHDSVRLNLPCNCLLNLYRHSTGFPDLINANGTLQQLKNAGGLRFMDREDVKNILQYDEHFRGVQLNETTTVQETQTLIRNTAYELFDFSIHESKVNDSVVEKLNTPKKNLFSDNKPLLNKYFNALDEYRGICDDQIIEIESLQAHATSLITYFKKKYSF